MRECKTLRMAVIWRFGNALGVPNVYNIGSKVKVVFLRVAIAFNLAVKRSPRGGEFGIQSVPRKPSSAQHSA